jgi:sRNA-binding regulator protein Hfq
MNEKLDEQSWLDQLINQDVVIFIGNGVKLGGVLLGHDLDVLFLGHESRESELGSQMIYKTFISTVQPMHMRNRNIVHQPLNPFLGRNNRNR